MDASRRERCFSSFGLFREEVIEGNARRKIGRFKVWFGFVAACFFLITIVFFVIHVNLSTGKETTAKSKRFAARAEADGGKEEGKKVFLLPEARVHPNHRYEGGSDEGEIKRRVMKDVYGDRAAIEIVGEAQDKRDNIQEIIRKMEMKEKMRKMEEEEEEKNRRKPIIFKGVYVKKSEEEEEERRREYFKEINEMVRSEKEQSKNKVYSDRASPFRLRGEEQVLRKITKKPITVMLDIYPVARPEEESEDRSKAEATALRPGFEPVPGGGKNVAYALVPFGKAVGMPDGSRMIMKLNLYPKRTAPARPSVSKRTFNRFGKKPVCQLIGSNAGGRSARAEWMDEDGNWIRANYVALKHRERKNLR